MSYIFMVDKILRSAKGTIIKKKINLKSKLIVLDNNNYIDIYNIQIKYYVILFNDYVDINIFITIGIFYNNNNKYSFIKIIYNNSKETNITPSYVETYISNNILNVLKMINYILVKYIFIWFKLRITGDVINGDFILIADPKIDKYDIPSIIIKNMYNNCYYHFGDLQDYVKKT